MVARVRGERCLEDDVDSGEVLLNGHSFVLPHWLKDGSGNVRMSSSADESEHFSVEWFQLSLISVGQATKLLTNAS